MTLGQYIWMSLEFADAKDHGYDDILGRFELREKRE